MAGDHHGYAPPIDSSAPIAPRLAPTIPMTRPNVLPAISEKPPASWIAPDQQQGCRERGTARASHLEFP